MYLHRTLNKLFIRFEKLSPRTTFGDVVLYRDDGTKKKNKKKI